MRFSKTGALRFLSHHDVMRLFERACRRADLPLRLTQGFAPHPRLVFATALELGVESQAEVLEIEMARWIPPTRAGERVVQMTYRMELPEAVGARLSPQQLAAFTARPELPFERPRKKRIQHLDLRPSLMSLELQGSELVVVLRPAERGVARPAEIAALLTDRPLSETRKWPTKKTSMQMAP
ncbi:MAG: TIGR03936 family radical SAM-associated protein [Planctomycetota bacterium]